MYTIYTDKNENFECEVSVKNASLKGSIARLIVESPNNVSLVFNGKIEGSKCIVPVRKLKGILDENTRGKMHLEVVVEDTYFKPWESDFVVEEHTSVKVRVNEQKTNPNKPSVEVKVNQPKPKKGINLFVPLQEISNLCRLFGIDKKNLRTKQRDFSQLLKEYFVANPEYHGHHREILSQMPIFLK